MPESKKKLFIFHNGERAVSIFKEMLKIIFTTQKVKDDNLIELNKILKMGFFKGHKLFEMRETKELESKIDPLIRKFLSDLDRVLRKNSENINEIKR